MLLTERERNLIYRGECFRFQEMGHHHNVLRSYSWNITRLYGEDDNPFNTDQATVKGERGRRRNIFLAKNQIKYSSRAFIQIVFTFSMDIFLDNNFSIEVMATSNHRVNYT